MAGGPTRQDTWEISVQVEDVTHPNRIMLDLGIWDKKSGGQVDSEERKYRPGGMRPTISLGGSKNTDNVVVSRLYRLVRDHQDMLQRLFNGVGKAKMVISHQPLDVDANAFGRPIVWRGTLKRVTPPDSDSEGDDAAMIEIEMTPEGEPVVS